MNTDRTKSVTPVKSIRELRAQPLFKTFLMGGFECSSHRLKRGRRLDLVASTKHDKFAALDYERLTQHGIYAARDGLRWHLIDLGSGTYDFSSAIPMMSAARRAGVEVIWDLCHYGYPDGLNPFKPAFVTRFAAFARAFARMWRDEFDGAPLLVPVNEISFWAWAGGTEAYFNPFKRGRGSELKRQLVRLSIEAMEAVWAEIPDARFIHAEPLINVIADPKRSRDRGAAENHRLSQYEAWDMLMGRTDPELGGHEKYVDIMGLNYYSTNQWIKHSGKKISPGHRLFRPLHDMILEVHDRYKRPLFIAETGIENEARPAWFRYVCDEAEQAIRAGIPMGGICLYPIVNHPGWDNNRHCHNGLWDYPDETGNRELYVPLAEEIKRQQIRFGPHGGQGSDLRETGAAA